MSAETHQTTQERPTGSEKIGDIDTFGQSMGEVYRVVAVLEENYYSPWLDEKSDKLRLCNATLPQQCVECRASGRALVEIDCQLPLEENVSNFVYTKPSK